MTKRNWTDISDELAAAININGATDNEAATVTPKKLCYDFSKTNIVNQLTNKYVEQFYSKNNTQKGPKYIHYLRNHATSKDIRINAPITIESLKKQFEDTGHCLAYKISDSYATKLMFDFDCIKCKQGVCSSLIESETLKLIHDDVCEFISDALKVKVGCVIFKKNNSCNLHFYFNVNVSLPLLELLRKRLCGHLNPRITAKYIIDDVYMLDLPYSTKNGRDIYKLAYHTPNIDYLKFSCLPADPELYDVELQLSTNEVYDNFIILGSFKTKYNSEWTDSCEYEKYLITPLEFSPKLQKNENSLVNSIKLSKVKAFDTSYTLLKHYITQENVLEEQCVANQLRDDDILELLDSDCKKIYNGMIFLGNAIGAKLYESGVDNMKLVNIIKFIITDNCNYAFYAICTIIFHFYKITNQPIDECKANVIKLLLLMVENSEYSKNELLLQNLHALNTFDCITNLEKTFENSDMWFKYIIYISRIENLDGVNMTLNDKRVSIITLQLKVYDSLDCILTELVELCKLLIPIIRVEYSLNKFYYYVDDGLYIPITSDKFFNHNTVQIQMIEIILKRMMDTLVSNKQLELDLMKKVNMKDVWLLYFKSLSIVSPNFNFYDYFISTNLGVFNTLTGLYMSHTPLLYMNTRKAYCKLPAISMNVEALSIYELNNYLLKDNQSQLYANVLSILKTEQKKIFYGAVMIPGLLCLPDTLYDEKQENNMLQLIYEHIIKDESEISEKLLYFVEVLIVKYCLKIENLLFVANKIVANLKDLGDYSRTDLRKYCISNSIKYDQTKFKIFEQEAGMTLYDQLRLQYKKDFKSKTFTLATIMGAFEVAQISTAKLDMFEWVADKAQITLSTNNLFYNYENYNLSMKSYDNIKRVISYLATNEIIPEPLLNLTMNLSTMLRFNEVMVTDFLNVFSMIYNHNSKRKKLALLIGSPNSGKSTYQHMLIDMHGKSIYSVTSIFQAEGQGPSPEIVNALSSYLFSIVELKSMTPTTMKGMISGDVTHKRLLHQNDMLELKPLSFSIAAANTLPNIHLADEAIRDRLAPFLFRSIFIDSKEIDKLIDDNTLLANVCNYMISSTKFQISGISRQFSNILYENFITSRDKYGLIQPKINRKNETSQKLINQILIKNNAIYYILNASNIVFDDSLFISYDALKEHLADAIEKYNETTKKKRFDWSYVRNELSLLFKHKETDYGIRGLGLRGSKKQDDNVANTILTFKNDSFVTIREIKAHLYHGKKLNFNIVNNIVKQLIHTFKASFDVNRKGFTNHILK
ncbi:helicase [Carcinus maenas nudivirus]|uniref:Helicase n=1 Tax=Carcinus maenas nudivirus TaxID=2880837 RepID=A0AAE8Y2E4_9VIRU|nr:helicase [Carcinus maenas nudivirus]UBZ25674.1 helicase [Carcinus maenas nudivirus]